MSSGRLPCVRERIDELSMQLLLADGSNPPAPGRREEISASLAAISESARVEGFEETALAAASLAVSAGDDAGLREGIMRLQAVLEEDARRGCPVESANPIAHDPELLADFVVEAREHLSGIEQQCLTIEQGGSGEALHALFRGFHTIKGLAGFLELEGIQAVAHEVETLLDHARNGDLAIGASVIDVILESADYLSRSVAAVEGRAAGGAATLPTPPPALLDRIGAAAAQREAVQPDGAASATEEKEGTGAAGPTERAAAALPRSVERFSVRVDTTKLDYLVDMVGEMVIAQSMVRHDPVLAGVRDPNLLRNLSQLNRVTTEVQRTTMSMRMIPIGQLFSRTARLVRDLSRKAGKKIDLGISGEGTEIDKTIADELADPLMHMVRNSVDHGIETPAGREAAGKPPLARIGLAAYHQGGQIVVEISDDGRGLDRDKILRKAREKGLVDGDVHSDTEVYNLIFEPGFSTAERITDVSGRGVGMDVVRRHIQKLRGRIDVESQPGNGTRFLLKLPLTLAIIDGLVVGVGESRYIVPIFAVREIFRPTGEDIFTVRGRDEMALVHGRLLPVVRFHRRFGIPARFENPCDALMIVSESDAEEFCLMVDELLGRQEVVIKSMGETLKNVSGIAGATILGDGRVGLIVDMDAVFRRGADG